MAHQPEPWEVTEVGAGEYFIVKFKPNGDGWEHSVGEVDRKDDAERIVACVNACRYIETSELMGHSIVPILDVQSGNAYYELWKETQRT